MTTVQASVPFSLTGRNERLYAALLKSGMSYEALAEQVGVDCKTVERWVTNPQRTPYPRLAHKAAVTLGIDADYLWPSLASSRKYPARSYFEFTGDAARDYRASMIARRDALQQDIARLQAEVDYLSAVLAIPAPASPLEHAP